MAPVLWTNLPPDILQSLSKILNSDVDLLRLRSVCSSWRTSLPLPQTPNPFPLKVAPLLSHPNSQTAPFYLKHAYPTLPSGGHYFLNYTTLYRLSPPHHAAANPSHGWLFRVSQTNPDPNIFNLLTPLLPAQFKCLPGMLPQRLNLLDYRISEICKCYNLSFVDDEGLVTSLAGVIRKVIVLRDFVAGCDFAVLVLVSNRDMRYWKFGGKDWTPIDTGRYDFDDVILFEGKCYAICAEGVLVSFDSDFNMTVVHKSNYDLVSNYNNFVVYESELYVVSKIYDREPDEYSSDFEGPYSSPDSHRWYASVYEDGVQDEVTQPPRRCVHSEEEDDDDSIPDYVSTGDYDDDEGTDENDGSEDDEGADEEWPGPVEISLRVKVFKTDGIDCWHLGCLEDNEIFLSSDDVSVGVSTKDFGHCKGNCVYMAHRRFFDDDRGIQSGDHHGVYDFNYKHKTKSLILERTRGYAKIYWPPPDWLHE